MAEEKDLAQERKDELALCVEDANTKLTQIINNSVWFAYSKALAKSLVNELVKETAKRLEELKASNDLIQSTINALKKRFMTEWLNVIAVLKENAVKDNLGIIAKTIQQMESVKPIDMESKGITIDLIDNESELGVANAHITNLRDFMTDNDLGGSQRYTDYVNRLNNALVEIKNNLANGTLTLRDSKGRVKSIRNMAEIETRYKMITEDLKRNGVGLNDFVVASAHANASERCSWWQGKIFLVDLDINSRPMGQYRGTKPTQTVLGHIDGKPYYSLREACENGFLSFNCQHRLIKYYKGVKPPIFAVKEVSRLRDATIRQRNMENTIRKWKRQEKIADSKLVVTRTDPFTNQEEEMTEREYTILMSKYWQQRYRDFSEQQGLPRYEWRTRITQYEEL